MKTLVAVNFIAFFGFGAALFYFSTIALIGPMGRVTELDRAEVINQKALATAFPSLADNPRHDVPVYIVGGLLEEARFFAMAGMAVSVINLLALGVVWGRTKQAQIADVPSEHPSRTEASE